MLGQSSNTKYKKISDFKTSADYLKYLYKDANGVVFRAYVDGKGDFHQHKHPYSLTDNFYNLDFSGDNQYISMQTFLSKKKEKPVRRNENIKRINAFYVDLDVYKIGLSKEQVLLKLHDEYIGSIIPTPTFIIDSGRGMYLIWKLANEDLKTQSRWEVVENYLIDALAPLGADNAVRDLARVLRIPFTGNSKSKSNVHILEFCDLVYTIRDIAIEYGLACKKKTGEKKPATSKQIWAVQNIVATECVQAPDLSDRKATALWLADYAKILASHKKDTKISAKSKIKISFRNRTRSLTGYCADLLSLMSMRKGEDCRRENALFLYRLWNYEIYHDANLALTATLEFNRALDRPLPEKTVIKATESAERKVNNGATYAFKVSTLIRFLDITTEELSHLTYLSKGEASRPKNADDGQARDRKDENHACYKRRLEKKGDSLKCDKITMRRMKIADMLAEGLTAEEIMKSLSISRATYYRDMACLASDSKKEDNVPACDLSSEFEASEDVQEASTEDTSLPHEKEDVKITEKGGVSYFQCIIYELHNGVVPYRLFVALIVSFGGFEAGDGKPPPAD